MEFLWLFTKFRDSHVAIDGSPESTGRLARYPAGPLLFNRLNNGGAVFLDDASRADEKEIITLWMQENP